MVKILRWILFIPLSFFAAAFIGGAFNYISQFLIGPWFSWLMGGITSGISFMFFGYLIVPNWSKKVKIILLIILLTTGILSAVGSLLGDNIVSIMSSVGIIGVSIKSFLSDDSNDFI